MTRSLLAGGGAALLALVILACSSDPERPPATSSGGSSSSSGAGSSSGDNPTDGSTTTDGSSSSGSSSGGEGGTTVDPNSIAVGLRASIDNAATSFDDARRASRQSGGYVVEVAGKDSFGNELRLTLTDTVKAITPGPYNCTGSAGATYGIIAYVVTGGTATWTALASGECSITILEIDNKVGGVVVGTFGGTAKRAASTERLITKGQFRLTLE